MAVRSIAIRERSQAGAEPGEALDPAKQLVAQGKAVALMVEELVLELGPIHVGRAAREKALSLMLSPKASIYAPPSLAQAVPLRASWVKKKLLKTKAVAL